MIDNYNIKNLTNLFIFSGNFMQKSEATIENFYFMTF